MKRSFLCISLCLVISGCMVGPDYNPPVQILPTHYSESQEDEMLPPLPEEDLAHWWTSFDDPFLNDLLAETLEGNFDLHIALERVCQARAQYWVQFTGILPEIDSDFQATRSRFSQSLANSAFIGPPIQSFFQTGFDALWEIDVFGGLRRAARSAYRTWEATRESARNVRITVLSEVAITYATICSLQMTTAIATETVLLDEELLNLSRERFQAGLANEQEVAGFLATFEADSASLATLNTSLQQTIYSLATLVGRPPETFLEEFEISRPIPTAIGKIPDGLPCDLLRRRPDIRSAERSLAASTEQIGVAVADLFPKFNLTGSSSSFSSNPLQGANVGYASNTFRKLFKAPSLIWGIGGLVTWPIFDFGQRLATVNIDISLEHQALLTYEKTVVAALQEVESDLVAYFNEEKRVHDLTQQTEANQRIFDLTSDLFQAGLSSYTQVLQAKEVWLTSLSALTTSQQALTSDLIALYKALGGGWECSYTP